MFAPVFLMLLNAASCVCSAEFEMFSGFDVDTSAVQDMEDETVSATVYVYTETTSATTTTTTPSTTTTPRSNITATTKQPNFYCLEDEKPSNIGPYEVPSERDLVRLVKKTLVKRFRRYNTKTLLLLRHIKEATKSAMLQVKTCKGIQENYRICLKKVNRHVTSVTKNLKTIVEDHKRNITFFINGKICNMAAMKPNPLMLVNKLAVEEASLKFAMPGFLRLLNECHKVYCKGNFSKTTAQKPRRRMRDPEFLVKYLTKNSLDLIKDLK